MGDRTVRGKWHGDGQGSQESGARVAGTRGQASDGRRLRSPRSSGTLEPAREQFGKRWRAGWQWTPLWVWALAAAFSWPAHLKFVDYLIRDPGASLAATLMANRGAVANLDFAFPYGPLTLALQQAAVWIVRSGPLAFAVLELGAALVFAVAMWLAIRDLRLGRGAVALAAIATLMTTTLSWTPVYEIETAAIAWVLVLLARGRRGPALALCVAGVLVKPSMSFVLGALLLAEGVWAWRRNRVRLRQLLLPPLACAFLLSLVLGLHFGWQAFLSMANPVIGADNYRFRHYSFLHDNPLLVSGANYKYYLGTPSLSWMIGIVVLACLLWAGWRHGRPEGLRWYTGLVCLLATLAFLAGFYGPVASFNYYISLPLIGLAVLTGSEGRPRLLGVLAVLLLLGNFTLLRQIARQWRQQRTSPVTANLWATPAQAAAWAALMARAPSERPVFLAVGSPEVLFPELGRPWHGYMVEGEATSRELARLDRRLAASSCVAMAPQWWLRGAPASVAAARKRLPQSVNRLYRLYGCQPN